MNYIGWFVAGVLLLLLIWGFFLYKISHTKRTNLNCYILYLLLSDRVRNDHKSKFEDWISTTETKDASALSLLAHKTIEQMADALAETEGSSVLGSIAMLWKYKKGEKIS